MGYSYDLEIREPRDPTFWSIKCVLAVFFDYLVV